MADQKLAPFVGQKYVSIETFKKNGQGVKTPVWFVLHDNAFYVYTEADDSGVGHSWESDERTEVGVPAASRYVPGASIAA